MVEALPFGGGKPAEQLEGRDSDVRLRPLVGCPLSKTNAIEVLNEPAECHQDSDPVPNGRAAVKPLVRALRDLESKWKAAIKRLDILSAIGFERRMPESRFSHLHVPLRTAEAARIAPRALQEHPGE